jgi:hypothetical protein
MTIAIGRAREHLRERVREAEGCSTDEARELSLHALFGAIDALVAIKLIDLEEMLHWQCDAYLATGRPHAAALTRRVIAGRRDPRAPQPAD